MKRDYIQPALHIFVLQHQTHLLTNSVNDLKGTAHLNYGGASRGGSPIDARTKEDDWDDVWDE